MVAFSVATSSTPAPGPTTRGVVTASTVRAAGARHFDVIVDNFHVTKLNDGLDVACGVALLL